MARDIPTEDQLFSWFEMLSNWGRWGADDELGTLNLITDEKRAAASRLVQDGVEISLARPFGTSRPRRSRFRRATS